MSIPPLPASTPVPGPSPASPASGPPPQPAAGSRAPPFAGLLSQALAPSSSACQGPPHGSTTQAGDNAASARPKDAQADDDTPAQNAPGADAAGSTSVPQRTAASSAEHTDQTGKSGEKTRSSRAVRKTSAGEQAAGIPPGLPGQAPAAAPPGRPLAAAAEARAAARDAGAGRSGNTAAAAAAASLDAAGAAGSASQANAAAPADGDPSATFGAALTALTGDADAPAAHRADTAGADTGAGWTGGAAAVPVPAMPVAAPATTAATAQLSAPPGSPDFAAQLGTQLTTFVRDGVQHARLELNPADMGPLSVHIEISGQTAQLHLAAAQAQTRSALEQAMPQLAASLHEAGLTLTGGGVFEQPRQSSSGDPKSGGDPGRQTADGGAALAAVSGAPSVAVRQRGVVDLVA